MIDLERVELANLGRGIVSEYFDREFQAVLANIADPNTKTKTARKVVIELTLVPNEDRTTAHITVSASSKLAPVHGHELSVDLVQEGRHQVAYQRKGRQGEIFDNVRQMESK